MDKFRTVDTKQEYFWRLQGIDVTGKVPTKHEVLEDSIIEVTTAIEQIQNMQE